jgi:cytoskeleton protein RodZ
MPLSGIRPAEVSGQRVVEIAVGENSPSEEEFRFQTVGEQLKAERERLGLSLSDLAAKTRVPMRHLESIEQSEFSALPGSTYTLGFARSYARALNMDSAKASSDLRVEMAQHGHEGYIVPVQNYEPADPARVPSRTLAWTAAAIGVLVVTAYFVWRSMTLSDAGEITAPVAIAQKSPSAPKAKTPDANGPVVLTATDNVWIKIYDAGNKRIYEKEMATGDSFTVPQDVDKPMIVTGRPQALSVTIGGKTVQPLGDADATIVDVEISAAALLARPTATDVRPQDSGAAESGN